MIIETRLLAAGAAQGGTIRSLRPIASGLKRVFHIAAHPGSMRETRRDGGPEASSIPALYSTARWAFNCAAVRRSKNAWSVTGAVGERLALCGHCAAHPSAPRAARIPAASSTIAAGTRNSALTKVLWSVAELARLAIITKLDCGHHHTGTGFDPVNR